MSVINLYHGDSLAAMREMPDKVYSLAIVDPPYGIGVSRYGNGSRRKKYDRSNNNAWDDLTPDKEFFDQLFRVSENQIIWGGNYFALPPTKGFVIWDKQQPEGVTFAGCEFGWTSFNNRVAKIFRMRPQNMDGGKIHPTQKPIALYKWLLKGYAKLGDKILDTHGGSMGIAIATHDMGFDLDLWELDADYYKAGVKRYNQHIAQGQFFLP